MKKSIKLLALLLVVFIAADQIICYSLSSIDKKVLAGQGLGKTNHFLSLKDSVDLLVFGSSRASHHIDNFIIDSVSYNMGADATKIAYAAALISTLTKKKQTILVHLDQHALFDKTYLGEDVLGLINLVGREEGIKDIISSLYPEEIYISNIFKSYVYNGKTLSLLKNYFIPKYNYKTYHGYDPIYPNQEQTQVFADMVHDNKHKEFNPLSDPIILNNIVDSLIESIIEKVNNNDSKLIFFTSPTFYKTRDVVREKTKTYFNSKGVEYYDFSDFLDETSLDNWKDYTHLSASGADIFSKRILKVLK